MCSKKVKYDAFLKLFVNTKTLRYQEVMLFKIGFNHEHEIPMKFITVYIC